ncbi:hypothetical protein MKX03_036278 [Papaver bracteatum]|nr:hypothetical protein MKX03_036278 [Papaver bracteatum]
MNIQDEEEKKSPKLEEEKKKAKEFAFVLGLPLVFNRGTVGAVMQEFTNIGLKLIVMEFVTDGPFLVMKLQGDDAVKRACELVSTKKVHPLWDRWPLRFILIKPKAFENGIMPDLLSTIENTRYYVKGLKMVNKSEVPYSVAWSDDNSSSMGETHKEEFGIALIVVPPLKAFDEQGSLRLGKYSEFVYVSERGESLKFVEEFFRFGVVGWVDSVNKEFCGGKYEPTLTGLLYEDD